MAVALLVTLAGYSYVSFNDAYREKAVIDAAWQDGQSQAVGTFRQWTATTIDSKTRTALEWSGKDSQILHVWPAFERRKPLKTEGSARPLYNVLAKSAGGRYFLVQVYFTAPPTLSWQVDDSPRIMEENDVVRQFVDLKRPDLLAKYNLPKMPA